jgi:hypothetical protein
MAGTSQSMGSREVAFLEDVCHDSFHFHNDGIGLSLKNSLETHEEIVKMKWRGYGSQMNRPRGLP